MHTCSGQMSVRRKTRAHFLCMHGIEQLLRVLTKMNVRMALDIFLFRCCFAKEHFSGSIYFFVLM